jgi:putative ABC transport system permease protein
MVAYQIRLAWISLRRNPWLSLLSVAGIGLGIAVSMTFVTAYYRLSGDPIPQKSDRLFYVQVDNWRPDRPWDDDEPTEPADQISYPDMTNLMRSEIPTYQSGMHLTNLTVHPAEQGARPFRESVRMCFADFFPMFDVPFRYGAGWTREADLGPEPVVVLGAEMNQRLFGGADSVGRTLRIEDREFRVAGVLEPWSPLPKFYDLSQGEFNEAEQIFLPFRWGQEMEIRTSGNTSNWKPYPGNEYRDWLNSETIWIQMWVQLDTAEQQERYRAFLAAYGAEQKAAGRIARPENTKLRDVMTWMRKQEVVPDEAVAMLINALLFLLICSVNLIGILLGKFLTRAPEVGIRRALGASRRWVFLQHLIECEIIGVAGCAVGLGLSIFGLDLIDRLFEIEFNFGLDGSMLGVALALALCAALVAGAYPAWRICRIQPAAHLKTQ